MGKKVERKLDAEVRPKKRSKKKKEGAQGIIDVLSCPPLSQFHCELVVGNGIGDDAVEDAAVAFKRAWEARRQKAYETAAQALPKPARNCAPAEHLIVGPFSSNQDWKIDVNVQPMTATTWCWVGYESIRFCKPS